MSSKDTGPDELEGTEQPFVSHLIELRDRLVRALLAVGICFGVLSVWPGPSGLYDLLATDIPSPDLVIYLQAPTEVLEARLKARAALRETEAEVPDPDAEYLREVNEAYQHYFFHYSATPLLVVETSHVELHSSDEALEDLVRQIGDMGRGTQYYVPRP